ncbi:hypothetical protein L596_025248 [Steinernema carpocapsae]|uniref:Uncharacterized protein n=1 Tax=Steinernema carpocapsae TaxID=34508 RepID=A0A4U5M834_STECR|nr:hypothetical protein L596_025248 [Steinernema carpocapsae]
MIQTVGTAVGNKCSNNNRPRRRLISAKTYYAGTRHTNKSNRLLKIRDHSQQAVLSHCPSLDTCRTSSVWTDNLDVAFAHTWICLARTAPTRHVRPSAHHEIMSLPDRGGVRYSCNCSLSHFRVRRATKRCFERWWIGNGKNFEAENAIFGIF